MLELIKRKLEHFLKLPPEPTIPKGDEAEAKVFRASKNYLRYKYFFWWIGSIVGIFFTISVGIVAAFFGFSDSLLSGLITLGIDLVIWVFIAFGLLISWVSIRLEYDYRWYIVTNRSLRIREGIFNLREMTMTFANIQNIQIVQGPVQRYFGITDLMVRTAGGSDFTAGDQGSQQPLAHNFHIGFFRGVENAEEIRQLMMDRLKKLRNAGLGDEDDQEQEINSPDPSITIIDVLKSIKDESKLFAQTSNELASRKNNE